MDETIAECVEELKLNNPSLRDGSIKAYSNHIRSILKLCEENTITNLEDIFKYAEIVCKSINKESGLSKNTKKAYYSVLCSLTRGKALETLEPDMAKSYSKYVFEFEDLKRLIQIEKIKQKPVGEEKVLKHLTMKKLHRALLKHKKDFMDSRKPPTQNEDITYNIEALKLYIVGMFHYHFCLRNELPTMFLTDKHADDKGEWKKDNYIIVHSRNHKEMVINKNKVREPTHPLHKPRTEKIPTDLNWALNWWLKIHPDAMNNKLLDISESGYSKMVKRVWKHKDIELTSSLIRKLYACEVRKEHKGKLEKEIEACEKLDHSLSVHNTDYILYFD